nr:aldo/keto reductase [Enterocloster bolteae]
MEMEIKMKKLGFGTMRLPVLNQEDPASVDLEQVCKMVDTFMERGFTYFDTAYMYHKYESERAVKKALVDRWPRDRYVLADKLPLSHLKEEADMERFFQEQLEKCGVSYFDYYMLHNMSRSYYETAERLGRLPLSAGKRRRERPAESDFPSMRMLSFWRRFFQNTLSWILCSCS